MVWNEDYTTPNTWQPANLNIGSKATSIVVAHRHKPMSGDFINRDESRNHAVLRLDGTSLRAVRGSSTPGLIFEVEKFEGDGFGAYRLRDTESRKLLWNNVGKDWVRLGDEDPEDSSLLCFQRWEGFKPYIANHGEIAWRLWIKSRPDPVYIDSDGWLNTKNSGSEALFTFSEGYGGFESDLGEVGRKAGETEEEHFRRLDKIMEKKEGESNDAHHARMSAVFDKLRELDAKR